jgi:hypothetical protein
MSDPQLRLSPADAVAEISQFGSMILRKGWRTEDLRALREAIVRFNDLRAERIASGTVAPREKMLHTHGAGFFPNLIRQNLFSWSKLSEMFAASEYQAICSEYFQDDELYVFPARLLFRIHDPKKSDRSFVPFHQDSGSQDPRVPRVLNCWIPLDPGAGREAPGLQVVREPSEPNFPLKDFGLKSENAVYDSVAIDGGQILEQFADKLMAPAFDLGDGLVFSQDVIHRTYVTPQMTKPRMNFEFRVFSLRDLAPGTSPDDVRQNAILVAR